MAQKQRRTSTERNKELCIKGNSAAMYLQSNDYGPQKRLPISEGQHPNPEDIFTTSRTSAFRGGEWGVGGALKAQNLHGGIGGFITAAFLPEV